MGPAVAIPQDATLRQLAALMLERHVQAVLVVDTQRQAVGIVTERQLTLDERFLNMASLQLDATDRHPLRQIDTIDAALLASTTLRASDVMERRLLHVCIDEPLCAVVQQMLRREAEYAIVYERSAVVGMFGPRDLLPRIAGLGKPQPTGTSDADGQPVAIGLWAHKRSVLDRLVNG